MGSDRAVYLLMAAVMCCILLSAHGRSISIDRRGIVHAMGIDTSAEGYRVSLQIFQPAGTGADTAVDVTGANIAVAVSEGKTVSEAIAAAGSSTGKELFFGHLQLICLGSDITLDEPKELFAFAICGRNISPSTDLCMAEGKAEELMQLKLTEEETSAEALTSLLNTSVEYSQTVLCDLKSLLSDEGCAAMPVLSVKNVGDNEKSCGGNGEDTSDMPALSQSVELAGTAVFSPGGRIILDDKAALPAALLSGKAKKGSLVTVSDGEDVTSELDNCRRRRSICIENSRLILRTNITVSARPDHELDPEKSRMLSITAARELKESCASLQTKMLKKGIDIFGTEQLIKQRFPKLWLKYRSDTESLLYDVDVFVDVTVKVV